MFRRILRWSQVYREASEDAAQVRQDAAGDLDIFAVPEPPARKPMDSAPDGWWEHPLQPEDGAQAPARKRTPRRCDYNQLSLKHLDPDLACPEEAPEPRPPGGG